MQEIEKAREHGDLKENAEYHAARERQRMIDKKLGELNNLLVKSQIVDPSKSDLSRVGFGTTFTLADVDSEEEEKYTVVGSYEANSSKNIISYHSPIAKLAMGKQIGDIIELRGSKGIREFEIINIEYIGDIFED
jgi:transcription elongation factor GreA